MENPIAFPGYRPEGMFQGDRLPAKYYCGMTLRDYFAIHAPSEEIAIMGFSYLQGEYLEKVSQARYKYADAMLAQRLKPLEAEEGK